LIYISTGIALIMAFVAFKFRMKETQRPVSAKTIILPPIFMSTGALMFIFPYFRITSYELVEALTVGMLFSILLIKTSKFEVKENQIYMQRSKAFMFILVGLLLVRLVAKIILGATLELGTLSGMFFMLAFGMIVPWRLTMYFQYKKLKEQNVSNGKMA
jgi:membrane protein CcdC involved in cytochrome C biogenesis